MKLFRILSSFWKLPQVVLSVSTQALVVGASLCVFLTERDCGNVLPKPLQAVACGICRTTAPSAVSTFTTTAKYCEVPLFLKNGRQTAISSHLLKLILAGSLTFKGITRHMESLNVYTKCPLRRKNDVNTAGDVPSGVPVLSFWGAYTHFSKCTF